MSWSIYLHGECVDVVWFDATMSAADVKRSLVNHDGYDPSIRVERRS